MKNKLTSNLVLKILSVVVAFLFWLVIINITDPTTARTFNDIPVEIVNENVITSANQVYEITDGDKVNVTVRGKRSFVEGLKEKDFVATADMSGLSKVNAVSIEVELKGVDTDMDYEIDCGNAMLKVKLEKRVTQKFKVQVEHRGELSENYVLGEMVAKPNIVEVSCGESKFKRIDHVGVMVSLNGESEDFETEYSPILYDEDGDILDATNVTFSNDTIKVFTKVLSTKEIPVEVRTVGAPAEGYSLVQTDFRPETIRVSGSEEALKKAQPLQITINIDGAKKDVEKELPIINYLPDNLSIVGDVGTISVRCEIEKNGERSFTLMPSDITVKNLPADYTMTFAASAPRYTVNLVGKETKLSEMSLTDLGAYVDLTGCGAGSHLMEVKFTLPKGITMSNTIHIRVILQDRGENSTNNSTASPLPVDNSNSYQTQGPPEA